VTKSQFQHATAHFAQLDRPIADEAMRRLADGSDALLMEVNDNRFLAGLRQLLDTSTKSGSGGLALSGPLRRAAPALRTRGITMEFVRKQEPPEFRA
jgi:hypothetical protein